MPASALPVAIAECAASAQATAMPRISSQAVVAAIHLHSADSR